MAEKKPIKVENGIHSVFDSVDYIGVLNGGTGATTRKAASGQVANFGQLEPTGTYTDFNAIQQWGGTYVVGNTNGPSSIGSGQYYQLMLSIGSTYDWGGDVYACQLAIPRLTTGGNGAYIGIRQKEGGNNTANWGAWQKIRAGYADTAETIPTTFIGYVGNVSLDSVTDTAAEWSALPVGYSRMIGASVGTAGGAPLGNYGYFHKVANRDTSGGWGGIWCGYAAGQNYIGRSSDSSTLPSWDKLWSDANDGPSSGLDADMLDGYHASQSAVANTIPISDLNGIISVKGILIPAVDTTFFPSTTLVTAIQFDTSLDHEGGAWRKRCADKSWYTETIYGNQIGVGYYANEAAARAVSGATTNDYYYDTTSGLFKVLNAGSGTTTIYRGGRREFPQNGIITVEAARVVIWDCDYGAPRMWMVFVGGAGNHITATNSISCAAIKNGDFLVGATGLYRMIQINFVQDRAFNIGSAALQINSSPLSGRNSGLNTLIVLNAAGAIVNSTVNAVAITTLENAPLDAYGIPKPTIAVATAGGVSVIKSDGTVSTGGVLTDYKHIAFNSQFDLTADQGTGGGSVRLTRYPDYLTTSFAQPASYLHGTVPSLWNNASASPSSGHLRAGRSLVAGSAFGATLLFENPATPTKGMVAYITHTYNTGWLTGDIRRAWLADTTAETITAATPLSDDFSSGTAGWTLDAGGVWDAANTSLKHSGSSGYNYKPITCVVGKTYVIEVKGTSDHVYSNTYGFVATVAGGADYGLNMPTGATTAFTSFIATATTMYVRFGATNANVCNIDSVTVKLAEPDRCVKNKAITVVGSLTKAAVAGGANLVAYSGFSASNYLEEAYSSDLDFGTGDFCVMGWVNIVSANNSIIFMRGTSGGKTIYLYTSDNWQLSCSNTGSNLNTGVAATNGVHHYALVRASGVLKLYIDSNTIYSDANTVDITNTSAKAYIGINFTQTAYQQSWLSLIKIGATAPTAEQIRYIYETEKKLFEPNAQCTLAGTSSAVLAVDHDPVADTTQVLTSYGRSAFRGLVRVESEATPVGTPKAVSALGGRVVQVGATGADIYMPANNLRETPLPNRPTETYKWFTGTGSTAAFQTTFKPSYNGVFRNGLVMREGVGYDYLLTHDGFLWTVTFSATPAVNENILIKGVY